MGRGWDVTGFKQIADTHHIFVDRVYGAFIYSFDRTFRHPVFFLHADYDVASADILYIVREGADRMHYLFRIPVGLVLDT